MTGTKTKRPSRRPAKLEQLTTFFPTTKGARELLVRLLGQAHSKNWRDLNFAREQLLGGDALTDVEPALRDEIRRLLQQRDGELFSVPHVCLGVAMAGLIQAIPTAYQPVDGHVLYGAEEFRAGRVTRHAVDDVPLAPPWQRLQGQYAELFARARAMFIDGTMSHREYRGLTKSGASRHGGILAVEPGQQPGDDVDADVTRRGEYAAALYWLTGHLNAIEKRTGGDNVEGEE
jgi:hypothetical protein